MQRELLLLDEMAAAAEQAHRLVEGLTAEEIAGDRVRRDALQWNFTVLGEAAAQLPDDLKARFPPGALAATGAAAQPNRSRVLVDRPGHPAHDRADPAA